MANDDKVMQYFSNIDPKKHDALQAEIVRKVMEQFMEMNTWRNVTASHWEEIAELIRPTSRNTFFYGSYNPPGQKKTAQQIDSTGMIANERFAAICDSLLTPRNSFWHSLSSTSDKLKNNRRVKEWFEQVTKSLFKARYAYLANFTSQNTNNFGELGAFGNMAMFIDKLDPAMRMGTGFRYKSIPVGELFFKENHQGIIDTVVRWFRMTARQIKQKFPDTFPEALQGPLEKGSESFYDILHFVGPNPNFDPRRIHPSNMLYESHYVLASNKVLLQSGGYHSFPYAIGRYTQSPGEVYGRGPGSYVLPSLKTLNAEKRTFLKQGHRAADPILLTPDDGMIDFDMMPGAMNKGGMSPDGKPLVTVLPTGEIQITLEMMQQESGAVQDMFLVSLFQILTESPQMTATEVIERVNEKGILIAPTVGRQMSEYLGPMIHREMALGMELGMFPPPPPELRQLADYEVVYTSPLSKAMRAGEAAGFMRTLEMAKEMVAITQDPTPLDNFNLDVAIPEIADIQSTPIHWMATDEEKAAIRKSRAQQQQMMQKIQAMPSQAAMIKAQKLPDQSGQGQAPQQPGAAGAPQGSMAPQQPQGGP